jgi:hypothetical protein
MDAPVYHLLRNCATTFAMTSRISTYRYGSPGSERRPACWRDSLRSSWDQANWSSRGYFDQWLPAGAHFGPHREISAKKVSFAAFARLYEKQMKTRESQQVIDLLATRFFSL